MSPPQAAKESAKAAMTRAPNGHNAAFFEALGAGVVKAITPRAYGKKG
jgi:hypothetical protein